MAWWQTSANCGQTAQPAILSELLCILGAEGCVVDVNTFDVYSYGTASPLRFSRAFPIDPSPLSPCRFLSVLFCLFPLPFLLSASSNVSLFLSFLS